MGNIQKDNLPPMKENGTFAEYMASAWLWLQMTPKTMEHHKRVKPGGLKLKQPTSVAGLYNKFFAVRGYAITAGWMGNYSYQFFLLLYCTIF